jgi:hypothetical protein
MPRPCCTTHLFARRHGLTYQKTLNLRIYFLINVLASSYLNIYWGFATHGKIVVWSGILFGKIDLRNWSVK